MIEKYINEYEKPCYKGVSNDTKLSELEFYNVPPVLPEDLQVALHTNIGSLTVLDRLTGFGWRDTETGYRDTDGNFWLASGNFDVRYCGKETIGEAIQWVKDNANTCIPELEKPQNRADSGA